MDKGKMKALFPSLMQAGERNLEEAPTGGLNRTCYSSLQLRDKKINVSSLLTFNVRV